MILRRSRVSIRDRGRERSPTRGATMWVVFGVEDRRRVGGGGGEGCVVVVRLEMRVAARVYGVSTVLGGCFAVVFGWC